jgi:hypothetical protein
MSAIANNWLRPSDFKMVRDRVVPAPFEDRLSRERMISAAHLASMPGPLVIQLISGFESLREVAFTRPRNL